MLYYTTIIVNSKTIIDIPDAVDNILAYFRESTRLSYIGTGRDINPRGSFLLLSFCSDIPVPQYIKVYLNWVFRADKENNKPGVLLLELANAPEEIYK